MTRKFEGREKPKLINSLVTKEILRTPTQSHSHTHTHTKQWQESVFRFFLIYRQRSEKRSFQKALERWIYSKYSRCSGSWCRAPHSSSSRASTAGSASGMSSLLNHIDRFLRHRKFYVSSLFFRYSNQYLERERERGRQDKKLWLKKRLKLCISVEEFESASLIWVREVPFFQGKVFFNSPSLSTS